MSSKTSTLSIQVPVELQQKIDVLAATVDRSQSWVVTQALESYVNIQLQQIEEIKKAIQEADAGDFATDEEMEAVFNKYRP